MTPEEAEKVAEQIRHGAIVRMEDPRFTQLQQWFFGLVGVTIVGGIGAILSGQSKSNENVAELTKQVAILIEQRKFDQRIDDAQDEHFRATDAKVDRNSERLTILERSVGIMGGRRAN